MNIKIASPHLLRTLIGLAVLTTPCLLPAYELKDPAYATGAGSVDPSGGTTDITVTATGSTAKATIETLAGFRVVRTFTNFEDGKNNLFYFTGTSATYPAVQISFSGTGSLSSNGGNVTYGTSGSSGIRFASNNTVGAHNVVATIDFGSWNGTGFDSASGAVSAACFTLGTNSETRFERVNSITATFLSVTGSTLSTQTITGPDGTGSQGLYFGYQTSGTDRIGSVVITMDIKTKTQPLPADQALFGLDDIGFTANDLVVVPEPATMALIAAGVLLPAVVFWRRCRRQSATTNR